MKKLVLLAIVLTAFALAEKTHLIKVTKADGTTERFWVETVSKITFVADKNDSAKTVSIPLSIQKLDASVSWNRQTSSLSVVVPEARSSVQIFDVLGNCVYRNASLVKGANEVRPGLKAGFYAVRVQSGVRQTILNINVKE
ncbi:MULTISPECIES: T9SS type A sorting domain-containing protein [unclassified Fibrobacter]|uniref:T9SS type A sorting domain-containing protein n=1 Tax=unclassified Fibrobacter TaxID=2634177 RepID=UPI0009213C06|nr:MULTISPECIES: T9SS type A sorting domain-containing protein [unclassified Fibrobacter]SHM60296.1 Por secretion system C-terminal sorting domain-containing protein [Fibrobacter sp. UWB7]SMG07853.1 Por secretion system C-terminal sorting domain-containing protein [Fibrobacter sp. UWB13]